METCPRCGEIHYFENEAKWCEKNYYLEVMDADISNPPEWVEDVGYPPVIYHRNDPNYSGNLPK